MNSISSLIDCDANATYRPDEVIQGVIAGCASRLFNPSSMHRGGQAARATVERSREAIRSLVGARPEDLVIFTSGATEANNALVFGLLNPGDRAVTSSVEHPCILGALGALSARKVVTTLVDPRPNGEIRAADFEQAMAGDVRFLSVMLANNETGAVFPVAEICAAARARAARALVHTDAAQALGKMAVSFSDLGVDAMTVSAHKIGGLSGVGALILRHRAFHWAADLSPLLVGGPQEQKLRGGTENVLGIAVFGIVAEQLKIESDHRTAKMLQSRDTIEQAVLNFGYECEVHCHDLVRLPNTTSLYIPGVNAADLVVALDLQGVLASAGAACSSGKRDPSHVLLAMGQSRERASSTIRLSVRADMTNQQEKRVIQVLRSCIERLRQRRQLPHKQTGPIPLTGVAPQISELGGK